MDTNLLKLEVIRADIISFTKFIDFFEPEKEYEKKMYQLFNYVLEHESFSELDKFDRTNWFFFTQTVIGVLESVIRSRDQILKLEETLEKLEFIKP